jgi:hypothetical protein
MNRRTFFASAIAFVAALFTPKPKLAAAPPPIDLVPKGWAEPLPARIEAYDYYIEHQAWIQS